MPQIRPASPADADAVAAVYEPFVLSTAVSFETSPPTPEEMRERIERWSASHAWLVAEIDGEVAGFAYGSRFHERPAYQWSSEVTVYVDEGARGQGLGRGLTEALLEQLRARGYVNAFAGIALPNPPSVGLFERLGFRLVGTHPQVGFKLGSWHDVGWWHLELRDKGAERPAPPT